MDQSSPPPPPKQTTHHSHTSSAQAPTTSAQRFTRPLRIPGQDGVLALRDVSEATPLPLATRKVHIDLLPSRPTELLAYTVEEESTVLINPVLVVRQGVTFAAEVANTLDEATNIHWHGLEVEWRQDGHPTQAIAPGATASYRFPIRNRGGAYWYHPHTHGHTAWQVYHGLAGFFLVEDDDERRLRQALDLTVGETEHLLLLQDRIVDTTGALVYPRDPMSLAMGVEGDTILVNLTVQPTLTVGTRLYRFRVLNGSNARIYRLAFVQRTKGGVLPLQVISTDGGLLDHPYPASDCFLAPGERIDLLLDLVSLAPGEVVMLRNLAFDPMHHEMDEMDEMDEMGSGEEMMGGMAEGYTQQADLLQLVVEEQLPYARTIPSALSSFSPLAPETALTRSFTLSSAMVNTPAAQGQVLQWLINGLTYQVGEDPIIVRRGTTEIWAIHSEARSMPHPMHLHGFAFQVLDRTNSLEQVRRLAVDAQGRTVTDLGWKDTVLVWPGETVRIAINFAHPFESVQHYVFHCHILEHEDNGMMLNVRVEQ